MRCRNRNYHLKSHLVQHIDCRNVIFSTCDEFLAPCANWYVFCCSQNSLNLCSMSINVNQINDIINLSDFNCRITFVTVICWWTFNSNAKVGLQNTLKYRYIYWCWSLCWKVLSTSISASSSLSKPLTLCWICTWQVAIIVEHQRTIDVMILTTSWQPLFHSATLVLMFPVTVKDDYRSWTAHIHFR